MVKAVHCKSLQFPGALLVACAWCMQPQLDVQAAPTCFVITGTRLHLMHAPQASLLVLKWCMEPQHATQATPTLTWRDVAILC